MADTAVIPASFQLMRCIRVTDLASWPAACVDPFASASEALARLGGCDFRHLLVARGRTLFGAVCRHDLIRSPPARRVMACARLAPPVVSAADEVAEAVTFLRSADLCCLPVRASGRPWGILTRGDLIRAGRGQPFVRCSSCGDHHRVRSRIGFDVAFCDACLEGTQPSDFDDLYVDIGGGD